MWPCSGSLIGCWRGRLSLIPYLLVPDLKDRAYKTKTVAMALGAVMRCLSWFFACIKRLLWWLGLLWVRAPRLFSLLPQLTRAGGFSGPTRARKPLSRVH